MDALLEKLNKYNNVYGEEQFYLIGLAIVAVVYLFVNIFVAVVVFIIYLASPLVYNKFIQEKEIIQKENNIKEETGKLYFGNSETNKPIVLNLENLNHVFVIGMTRYGKTRLIMSLITELIQEYSSDEVKIAFSDAKAVSFNIFGRSKHLFAPIAKSKEETGRLIELLLEEMYKRINTFSEYHEEFCTNIDEYYELSGERLSRIVVIFDEVADSIEPNSQDERNLTTLAKMGLAVGIHLILITQRPTKIGISHEVTSQCQTTLCTYMKNKTEYGSVARIPSSIYNNMKPEKGLFMMFNPDLAPVFLNVNEAYEGWGFVKSYYTDNEFIKKVAVADSTTNLILPSLESSIPAWAGGEDDKLDAIEALEKRLGSVTPDDMVKYFAVSKRTAKSWLEKYEDN